LEAYRPAGETMTSGEAIVYIGFDTANQSGIFQQDFAPGKGTAETRRKLAGFTMDYVTESLGISPDGRNLVISAMQDRRTIKLVDHVKLRAWD
jgi:hypothetical protein